MTHQSQLYENQIDSLTSELTSKAKLINSLKSELLNEQNNSDEPVDFLAAFIEQILAQNTT